MSEIEWYVSESIDGLPVARNPRNLRTAIAPFAKRAAMTTDVLPAMWWVTPPSRIDLPTDGQVTLAESYFVPQSAGFNPLDA
ncbi:hypothetical protein HFX_0249 [Haloferax mediterranei ATCC 33500]|uniref:Uncharacterized protein n=1 Tax=Haloferax mediterranei (strain ATCC 33500 / DSM 1411 / JCM 8866 / NBRC 14739 / NCIMB 2177 / R-4) TaxID=523841 RepID=I3R181_HALMT|nr:hypothetical protein HFX_0249 [Haloferax mediterranei ATCC 33500]